MREIPRVDDLGEYNYKMNNATKDKAFFVPMIDEFYTLYDFGCADMSLLKYVYDNDPYMMLGIGYDIEESYNPQCKYCYDNVFMCDSLEKFKKNKAKFRGESVLNLSSVIHEIYSYSTEDEIKEFWDMVFNSGFDYISIRDMFYSYKFTFNEDGKFYQMGYRREYLEKDMDELLTRIWTKSSYEVLDMYDCVVSFISAFYESVHVSYNDLYSHQDLIEFLLKYSYIQNWEKESQECYFPISFRELVDMVPDSYEIVYKKEYCLDYTRGKVINDFKEDLLCYTNTHGKLLLKRKDSK